MRQFATDNHYQLVDIDNHYHIMRIIINKKKEIMKKIAILALALTICFTSLFQMVITKLMFLAQDTMIQIFNFMKNLQQKLELK